MNDLHTELAARMPWTVAEGGSWWVINAENGWDRNWKPVKTTFTHCIARAIPESITGVEGSPLFEVFGYVATHFVTAAEITHARELIFVRADDPFKAHATDDQPLIDDALTRYATTGDPA